MVLEEFAASQIVSIVIQPRKAVLLLNEIKKLCTMKGNLCHPKKKTTHFIVKFFNVSPLIIMMQLHEDKKNKKKLC